MIYKTDEKIIYAAYKSFEYQLIDKLDRKNKKISSKEKAERQIEIVENHLEKLIDFFTSDVPNEQMVKKQ